MIEKLKEEREKRGAWHRKMEQEWEEKAERERLWQLESARHEELEKQAELFTKAQYIYQLIQEVKNELECSNLNMAQRMKLNEWVEWAIQHADRLNPINQILQDLRSPNKESD